MPGSASIRDVHFVGKGVVAELFEEAGFFTIADVMKANLDDVSDCNILKKIWQVIEKRKLDPVPHDWTRLARKAYRAVCYIKDAEVSADTDVPIPFRCPILGDWLEDPVIAPSGVTYERVNILRWLNGSSTDPFTREVLTPEMLVDNRALKEAIEIYRPLEERYLIVRKDST